jgi:serine/threonine-protein kinase PknG
VFEGETGSALLSDGAADTGRSRRLPGLRPAPADPGSPAIFAASMVPDAARRLALLEHAWADQPQSLDLPFRIAGAHIEAGSPADEVERWLEKAEAADPGDWRGTWYRGQAALLRGDPAAAMSSFQAVLAEVPGELVPKLALAHAHELAGELDQAATNFDLVSLADPSYTSAAFGLARCRRARHDRTGAVQALERVPPTSSRYEAARLAIADILTDLQPAPPGPAELARAAEVLEPLRATLDSITLHRLAARVLLAAAAVADSAGGAFAGDRLLGAALNRSALRTGAERELLACAHLAPTRAEKIRYVDEANRARPFSFV